MGASDPAKAHDLKIPTNIDRRNEASEPTVGGIILHPQLPVKPAGLTTSPWLLVLIALNQSDWQLSESPLTGSIHAQFFSTPTNCGVCVLPVD